jgi:lipopolysaccharide biosynthesis glycosyltransferase
MRAAVLLTFSESFGRPGVVAAASAAAHVPAGTPIVVASTDLGADTAAALARHVGDLMLVPTGPVVGSLPAVSRYVADTWTRVFVDEIMPDDVDRVVYLDADTLTVGSLAPLLGIDMGGSALLALDDPLIRTFAGRGEDYVRESGGTPDNPYLNTGVLVIDRWEWKRLDVAGGARRLVHGAGLPIDYVDQDVLNVVLAGRWAPLDGRWHRQVGPGTETIEDAGVLHFTGTPKPWEAPVLGPLQQVYRRAAESVGWWW